MSCTGACVLYMARRAGVKRYDAGQKRCTRCAIYTRWSGVYCPCCGTKMRVRRKNKRLANREVVRY